MTGAVPSDLPGAVLGLDPGDVRVGVAATDASRTIATPIDSVARDPSSLWPRLLREAREREARLVVVGLPRRLDGSEGEAAAGARALANEVAVRIGLPVVLWDERFTTVDAERRLISAGLRRRRRRATVDATAATLLLQSWLESPAARTAAAP